MAGAHKVPLHMQVWLFTVAPSLNSQMGAETHRQLFVPHGVVEEESELKVSVPGEPPPPVSESPSLSGGLSLGGMDLRVRFPVSEVVTGDLVVVVVPVLPPSFTGSSFGGSFGGSFTGSSPLFPPGAVEVSMKHPGGFEGDETKVATLYMYSPIRVAAVLQ